MADAAGGRAPMTVPDLSQVGWWRAVYLGEGVATVVVHARASAAAQGALEVALGVTREDADFSVGVTLTLGAGGSDQTQRLDARATPWLHVRVAQAQSAAGAAIVAIGTSER